MKLLDLSSIFLCWQPAKTPLPPLRRVGLWADSRVPICSSESIGRLVPPCRTCAKRRPARSAGCVYFREPPKKRGAFPGGFPSKMGAFLKKAHPCELFLLLTPYALSVAQLGGVWAQPQTTRSSLQKYPGSNQQQTSWMTLSDPQLVRLPYVAIATSIIYHIRSGFASAFEEIEVIRNSPKGFI